MNETPHLAAEIPAEPGSTFLEPMEWRARVAACGWAQWIYEGEPGGSGAFVFLRDSRNLVNISPRTAAVLHPTEGRDERTLRASMIQECLPASGTLFHQLHRTISLLTESVGGPSIRSRAAPGQGNGRRMSDWVHLQADSAEQLMQLHHFSIVKQQAGGNVRFAITVKEFAVPPPGQRVRFYAEADKPVNQRTASFVPCGWGASLFSALGDCVRLIRQFPYEGDEGGAT